MKEMRENNTLLLHLTQWMKCEKKVGKKTESPARPTTDGLFSESIRNKGRLNRH